MASLQIQTTTDKVRGQLDDFLKGIMDLCQMTKRMTVNRRTMGEVMINLFIFDDMVERFAVYCSERDEPTLADYWGAKALAYAFASKKNEGQAYYRKSQERRSGGKFAEWNQEFYAR